MSFKQSYRGYVREHLERIEEMVAFGHSHDAIRTKLCEEGFDAPLASFRDALMHARKWKRNLDDKNLAQVVKEKTPSVAQATSHTNQKEPADGVDHYFKRKLLFKKPTLKDYQ
jgi:hypothetical protein